MASLTRSEIDQMVRDVDLDWDLIEEQRRIYDEAETEKQRLWAEYEAAQRMRRPSRLGRILRIIWDY